MTTESNVSGVGSKATAILAVGIDDVIFGRGRRSYNHAGNTSFRGFVAEEAVAYKLNESRAYRRATAAKVIAKVQKNGGKFLQSVEKVKDNGQAVVYWKTVPVPVVIVKVKQALRDMGMTLAKVRPRTKSPACSSRKTASADKMSQKSRRKLAIETTATRLVKGQVSPTGVVQIFDSPPAPLRQDDAPSLAQLIEAETHKLRALQLRRYQVEYSLLDEQRRLLTLEHLVMGPLWNPDPCEGMLSRGRDFS